MPDKRKLPEVDLSVCMACRICVSDCPVSCLEDVKTDVDRYGKAYPQLLREIACTGCGICAKNCPVAAIEMVG